MKCSMQRKDIPRYERPCMGLCHGLPFQHWQGNDWHFHSRLPSGTLVPSDSHLLSPGLSEAQTQLIFPVCCRPNSALSLRDSPSFPQTHCNCRHKNWEGKVSHEWFHKLPVTEKQQPAAAQHFCGCWHTLLTCLRGWGCGRCGHSLLFHESAQCWQSSHDNILHCKVLLAKHS